jgi:hypothetical protein
VFVVDTNVLVYAADLSALARPSCCEFLVE